MSCERFGVFCEGVKSPRRLLIVLGKISKVLLKVRNFLRGSVKREILKVLQESRVDHVDHVTPERD